MKPVVLLDCDGVLADFVGAFLGVVGAQLGRWHKPHEVTSFGIANSLDLSKEEFDLCAVEVEQPGFCAHLNAYPGARCGVSRLREIAEVYIVTSPWNSNPTWTHDREAWLDRHFAIPHSHVVHTGAKHIVSGDFLVDDKTETCAKWQAAHPNGIAVQWQTPHNRRDAWTGRSTRSWDELCAWIGGAK